eukprot:TRINITY_DN83973_c0_g1_i1.p1 TRINITY_DN83973_c0_g1~~TRINITY_DN83973_c0_g1_i1.p1  ORF type:complete len:919 (+),score=204.09 TRINITY_DN83973_c0_g1_i1:79-2757(+)
MSPAVPLSARDPPSSRALQASNAPLTARGPRNRGRPRSANGNGGFRAANAAARQGAALYGNEQDQLLAALEKEYAADLARIDPSWMCRMTTGGATSSSAPAAPASATSGAYPGGGDDANAGVVHTEVDASEVLGLPGSILGAILAGKCRDQKIPATRERQKRFTEWMITNCSSSSFIMNDASVGPECAKGIMLALTYSPRFQSLQLACNCLGDAGAATLALAIAEHQFLQHVDLSANDINHRGANAVFESLRRNKSVKILEFSSKPGSLRNRLQPKSNAAALEAMLIDNRTLIHLRLFGTGVGAEGAAGLARGLTINTTLLTLDLAGNDIGPKGVVCLAAGLKDSSLEDLNLSDNRMGDEGLTALGMALGALTLTVDTPAGDLAWENAIDKVKASLKYAEAYSYMKRVLTELTAREIQVQRKAGVRDTRERAREAAQGLVLAAKSADKKIPRLKVLQVANSGGTAGGVSILGDALVVNNVLEKLALDHNEHRDSNNATGSVAVGLACNTSLRHLGMGSCFLGLQGFKILSRALAVNEGLKSLAFNGNVITEESASSLGSLLAGLGPKSLKVLNLNSCHLDDAAGVAVANGLAANQGLETLLLRDNCLHEVAAASLIDALQRNASLTSVNLELNSIDMRYLSQIKQLLARNSRLREKAMPEVYRQRIDQLLECEKEVEVLNHILERNRLRKRKALMMHAAKIQILIDKKAEEKMAVKGLEDKIESIHMTTEQVFEECSAAEARLQSLTSEGNNEATELRMRITTVEEKMKNHERHLEAVRKQLADFDEKAGKELAEKREELDRAEKARSSAALLAAAAQQNLDSFSTSLKAIGEDIAGGSHPRQRLMETTAEDVAKMGASHARSPSSSKTGRRPSSANKTAKRPRSGRPKGAK